MCPEPTEGIPTYMVSLPVSFVGGGSFFKVVTANDSYILHANILTKIGLYVVS